MSSIDWPTIDKFAFDLIEVDGFDFAAAVAEMEAHRQTRDAITAVLLEDEVIR